MNFTTIWTIPAMTLMERLRRTRDWFARSIAGRIPLRIRYWVAMQEIGYAVRTSENIPATTCTEILNNLRSPTVVS